MDTQKDNVQKSDTFSCPNVYEMVSKCPILTNMKVRKEIEDNSSPGGSLSKNYEGITSILLQLAHENSVI